MSSIFNTAPSYIWKCSWAGSYPWLIAVVSINVFYTRKDLVRSSFLIYWLVWFDSWGCHQILKSNDTRNTFDRKIKDYLRIRRRSFGRAAFQFPGYLYQVLLLSKLKYTSPIWFHNINLLVSCIPLEFLVEPSGRGSRGGSLADAAGSAHPGRLGV